MKLEDLSDAQFEAAYRRLNVEAIASALDEPKGLRKRGAAVHDRAKKLKLGRCKRITRDECQKFIQAHKTPEKFKEWVEKVEKEPVETEAAQEPAAPPKKEKASEKKSTDKPAAKKTTTEKKATDKKVNRKKAASSKKD